MPEEQPSHADESTYLREKQYGDASNLNARQALHRRFSTNHADWFRWVFDRFDFPATAALLELGTGPADLWQRNLDRLPPGWSITLSDFSAGMLSSARATLGDAAPRFSFQEIDAQQLPFPAASLDGVIANHMLYHVPDRARALAEIRRVLKPGGTLVAATNSADNMRALHDLVARATGPIGADWSRVSSLPFTLENGAAQLAVYFAHVQRVDREDALLVTEVEPLVAYVQSAGMDASDDPDWAERFRAVVTQELARTGALRINKGIGLFIAHK
ncbi:MAG: class I SAM-dependent methyltransferase [Caldilineaceae bacterium]|nr:class I SAM-dependent methyltransferase [Caldilineaceae bacterium]